MSDRVRGLRHIRWLATAVGLVAASSSAFAADYAGHPVVGSWFGRAVQVCASGVAPSACANGNPAVVLFMTPTLYADGNFIGNDSFAVGNPPLGPHTTAHGQWTPTSTTGFTADYTFMQNPYPPPPSTAAAISALRFRWVGQVVDSNTAVGYVNVYSLPAIPLKWSELGANQFPSLPAEAEAVVRPPTGFVEDPSLCRTEGCPLVFKFTIKRVVP